MPLVCLALVAKGAGIPELQGTVTVRRTVLGRPPHAGHFTNSELTHTPTLSMKKAYLLNLELQLES